jgi:CheY-like chemotaxis protein
VTPRSPVKKLLIVDDTPRGLIVLREILSQPYLTLFEASSGRQAIEIHRRENVDLIIMDLHMPGMDGEQVVRTIRADGGMRRVSVLIFAENPRPGLRERCLAAGANDFLAKPFRGVDLLQRVGQLLDVAVRKDTKLLAHVEVAGQGATPERFVARILNLSTSGMLLEADAPLEPGREVVVKFFVPGSHLQSQTTARVMRRAGGQGAVQWGVRFVRLDESTKRVLKSYVGTEGKARG